MTAEKVSLTGLALYVIDAEGTCYEDATFKGLAHIWRDLGEQGEQLKEYLVALLGEPDAEMLMDNNTCRELAQQATAAVVLEHRP